MDFNYIFYLWRSSKEETGGGILPRGTTFMIMIMIIIIIIVGLDSKCSYSEGFQVVPACSSF